MPHDLTPEDVLGWLTPSQALQLLNKAFKDSHTPKHVMLERLRGEMVQAVAGQASLEGRYRTHGLLFKIPAEHWERIDTTDPLWRTGDATYNYLERSPTQRVTVRLYGIKFEPQSVQAIVAQVSSDDCTEETSNTIEQKGPAVSDAHLQAWFDFYKAITAQAEDTEGHAWSHARRCFPGKTVSRDRVRTLRGSQRRGPKSKGKSAK